MQAVDNWPANYLVRACDDFYSDLENRGAASAEDIFARHFQPNGVGPNYIADRVFLHRERWREFRNRDPVWREWLRATDALWSVVMTTLAREYSQRDNARRRAVRAARRRGSPTSQQRDDERKRRRGSPPSQ